MMLEKNIKVKHRLKTNMWRKVALTSWNRPNEPVLYARVELKPEKLLSYIDGLNKNSKHKITLTHAVGKICGILLHKHEDINSTILYKHAYARSGSDIFFHVSLIDESGKENLSGVKIEDCALKSIAQIASELNSKGNTVKSGQDITFNKIKRLMKFVPLPIAGFVVWLTSFIQNRLNLWTPFLGTKRDTFGAMMITNIGSFENIREAFVPFSHYTNVNSILALGRHFETPVVEEGQIKVGLRLYACWTLDHRVIDGSNASKMLRTFQEHFENPQLIDIFDRENQIS